MTQWVVFENAQDIAQAAADTIEQQAHFAIQQRGVFKLVLAGGTTPVDCYRLLAQRDLQWDRWQLFYGDERCLPANDEARNARIVEQTGLTRFIQQHFVIAAELGAEKGAEQYREIIDTRMPFDTVLLGMGEDGHTASLFPGHHWDTTDASVIAVHDAPKPPPDRISLGWQALQNCRQMLLLVSGKDKRQAVEQWRQGADLPISRVADVAQATVFIDAGLVR